MALYFKDTEITNIDNLVPQTGLDITDLWFGATNVYTVWATYEGALPATLNANGDDMRQYQIYGNTGGVGDRTDNVYNTSETTWSADNTLLDDNGNPVTSSSHYTTNFTTVNSESNYYLSGTYRISSVTSIRIYFYDESKGWISRSAQIDIGITRTFMTPANCKFIQIQVDNNIRSAADWHIKEGTTPPETYMPYGYEVDISVSDGTDTTIAPIYIGDTALQKDEYIDYQAEKVYRKSANVFDKTATDTTNGYIANRYVQSDGSIIISNNYNVSEYITVEPLKEYTLENVVGNLPAICEYDENFDYISGENYKTRSKVTIKTSASARYIRFSIFKENLNIIEMFTLTPTDPPIPLPALPTVDGTTIVDYTGSGIAPEKVLLKYRKEGY